MYIFKYQKILAPPWKKVKRRDTLNNPLNYSNLNPLCNKYLWKIIERTTANEQLWISSIKEFASP